MTALVTPVSARVRFLKAMEAKLGAPVLWAAKGPDAYDCSGSVTCSLLEAGGPDLRYVDNAQALHDTTRLLGATETDKPLPGDLAFYGVFQNLGELRDELRVHIIHVAVIDEFGGVLSADGATPSIKTLQQAMANPHNRVTRHPLIRYRKDCPVLVVHRNTLVDALDRVTR